MRLAILGNAAGGKSTLARRIATTRDLPLVELDMLLWRPGWQLAPAADYAAAHDAAIAGDAWVIEGLGRQDSIPARLARATAILLIDLPCDEHEYLARQRHAAWLAGRLEHPPAGLAPPPLDALLDSIRRVDRDWMPGIRAAVRDAGRRGATVTQIAALAGLDAIG